MMITARHPASDIKYDATSARNSTKKWGWINGLRIKKAKFWALPEDVRKEVKSGRKSVVRFSSQKCHFQTF